MKALVWVIAAVLFASAAKRLLAAGQPVPLGCKLVGTVKGTKLWAGDCTDAAALRGSETASLPEQAGSAIFPGQGMLYIVYSRIGLG